MVTTRPARPSIEMIDRLGLFVSLSAPFLQCAGIVCMRVRVDASCSRACSVLVRLRACPSPCGSWILRILPSVPGKAIRSCVVATRLILLSSAPLRVAAQALKLCFIRSLGSLWILGSRPRSQTGPPAFNCWPAMPPAVLAGARLFSLVPVCLRGCVRVSIVREEDPQRRSSRFWPRDWISRTLEPPRTRPGDAAAAALTHLTQVRPARGPMRRVGSESTHGHATGEEPGPFTIVY